MKKLLLATVALAALGGSAFAADLVKVAPPPPPRPVFTWAGGYIGTIVGFGWGDPHWVYTAPGGVGGSGIAAGTPVSINMSGALIGADLGYNWQLAPNWVFGLEGDAAWSGISGSSSCPSAAFSCQASVNWLGSVRGRIGLVANKLLFFGTAGFAAGGEQIQTATAATVTGTRKTLTGGTAGAGVEAMLNAKWSTKLEYRYYSLGASDFTVDNGLNVSADAKIHTVQVGLNYHY